MSLLLFCSLFSSRLRTIIDSDKILVLSQGQVIEFGSPYELLNKEQSEFARLVSHTGHHEAAYLMEEAIIASTARST